MAGDDDRYRVLARALSGADVDDLRRVAAASARGARAGRSSQRGRLADWVGPWVMGRARPLRPLVDDILGGGWAFSDAVATTVLPGMPEDDWHVDHPYYDRPELAALPTALAVQVVLPLVAFTARNGATQIRLPAASGASGDVVLFDGRPGDALVMDARVVHRSGANRSPWPRPAVLLNLVREEVPPFTVPPSPPPRPR